MNKFLKHFFSKLWNWIILWIGIILSIWIITVIYATYSWTNQESVSTWSTFTATMWNDMVSNINFLKDSIDWVNNKFWTLTDGKMCTSNWWTLNCNTNIPISWITTEVDPQVGALNSWKICTSDWSKINCNSDSSSIPDWDSWWIYYANTSPWLKTLTHNLWVLPNQVQWWYSPGAPGTWEWPVAWSKQDFWSSPIWVRMSSTNIQFTIRSDRTLYRWFDWAAWQNYRTGYYRILLWK